MIYYIKRDLRGDTVKIFGEAPQNLGKYYLICLTNAIVQAITEINVSTKFEGSWSDMATS